MKSKSFIKLTVVFVALSMISCKDIDNKNEQQKSETAQNQIDSTITLEKAKGSISFPDASLELRSPLGQQLNYEQVEFIFQVNNYKLGEQTNTDLASKLADSGHGQHIHFIVDNGPYSAHYEPQFSKELSPGTHHIVAFLSRSYHESVKNDNSYITKTLQIGTEETETGVDLGSPTLIYSRPKGEYSGRETDNLLLDFFLLNTNLSENGNRVKATINGKEFMIYEWAPFIIKGLPKGNVSIRLELLNKDGNIIEGAYNDVTRQVILKE